MSWINGDFEEKIARGQKSSFMKIVKSFESEGAPAPEFIEVTPENYTEMVFSKDYSAGSVDVYVQIRPRGDISLQTIYRRPTERIGNMTGFNSFNVFEGDGIEGYWKKNAGEGTLIRKLLQADAVAA